MVGTEMATTKQNALQALSARLQVDPAQLETTLKKTVFMVKDGGTMRAPSNEEFMALVVVANTYKLNPLLKELYAFVKDGKVVPIVPIDGWVSLVNRADKFNGVELIENDGTDGKLKSVTAKFYLKDVDHPVLITEYMAECVKATQTWTQWPRRMLRHKAYIQGARIAFGFSGIYEEDEADRIIEGEVVTPAHAREMPQAVQAPAPAPAPAQAPQAKAPDAVQDAGNPAEAQDDQTSASQASQEAGATADMTKSGLVITTIAVLAQVKEAGVYPATRGVYQETVPRKVKTKAGIVYDHVLADPDVPEAKIKISTWDKLPANFKPGDTIDMMTVKVVVLNSGMVCYGADKAELCESGFGG